MASEDRWPPEMQMLQEAIVWLVPDEEMARTLVDEAGIPQGFIDFGEPVWNRIKRILVEADKRQMIPALLAVIFRWYDNNPPFNEAKAAWETGQDRKVAAAMLRKAAKAIPEPIAVAKITRTADVVEKVEVVVEIPKIDASVPVAVPDQVVTAPKDGPPPEPEASAEEPASIYSDTMEPGDWYSAQRTLTDQEKRLKELEAWRVALSIMPTAKKREDAI